MLLPVTAAVQWVVRAAACDGYRQLNFHPLLHVATVQWVLRAAACDGCRQWVLRAAACDGYRAVGAACCSL